ncbi:chromate efflux transporter [Marinoscillum furvescens]|uniref:Chromate transporter n=1 Tax=Marinoscillum furvescens DSM 4134 TaxID=1122208 RepID=A0A3D9L694_MARFU|nr:chromate efflux transporter [Marinoscillum furvescens]REE01687.1 chromate transporter [Marinoscillum furvescens DSM 4134]
MSVRRVRYLIFLRDVLILSVTSFGGPTAHLALFLDMMVEKRGYITEKDLIELHALCQILPGPTSTQTITAIGFKIGGPGLAYLTLLFWALPALTIMISLALMINFFQEMDVSLSFLKFIQPIAVGIVAYSAYKISSSVVSTRTGFFLMIISTMAAYIFRTPWAFPFMLLIGGFVTAFKFKKQPVEEKSRIKINWSNFILWISVLVFAAVLGGVTKYLPIRLFENFYRNGSLIFGGGQVLVPLLYTEFVEFKNYLTSEEFLSGYGFVQALPGPVFSFSAYVGTLSMKNTDLFQQILGGIMAAAGVFLPGTFFIFFVSRFWEDLKKYRVVKASLEGINAVSSGMVIAAAFFLFEPVDPTTVNYVLMLGTMCLMFFTRIPTPVIIIVGLVTGIILK